MINRAIKYVSFAALSLVSIGVMAADNTLTVDIRNPAIKSVTPVLIINGKQQSLPKLANGSYTFQESKTCDLGVATRSSTGTLLESLKLQGFLCALNGTNSVKGGKQLYTYSLAKPTLIPNGGGARSYNLTIT